MFFFTVFRRQSIARWLALAIGVVMLIGALFRYLPVQSTQFRSTEGVVQQ